MSALCIWGSLNIYVFITFFVQSMNRYAIIKLLYTCIFESFTEILDPDILQYLEHHPDVELDALRRQQRSLTRHQHEPEVVTPRYFDSPYASSLDHQPVYAELVRRQPRHARHRLPHQHHRSPRMFDSPIIAPTTTSFIRRRSEVCTYVYVYLKRCVVLAESV